MNISKRTKTNRRMLLAVIIIFVSTTIASCIPSKTDNQIMPATIDDQTSRVEAIGKQYLTAKQWLDTFDSKDYNGYEFTVVTTKEEAFVPDGDGLVQQAIGQRNDWVQSKYNITINAKLVEEDKYYETIKTAEQAQIYLGDMYSAPVEALSRLAADRLLYNIYSLPYVNLKSEYVDQELLKATTANNSLFIMIDSLSDYYGSQWCVFYDLDLIEQLGLSNPIDLVKSGEWTWDALISMSESVKTLGNTYNGYVSYVDKMQFSNAVWNSGGVRYFGDTFHNPVELRFDYDKAQVILDNMKKVTNSDLYSDSIENDAITEFSSGNSLFLIYRLDTAALLANNSREWGLVPLPKADVAQESYSSYLDWTMNGISIPASAENTERTGMILNALLAASYEHIEDAVKSAYINFYLRNNSSGLMLYKIFDTNYVDLAFIYGESMDFISLNTYELMDDVMKRNLDLKNRFNRQVEIIDAVKKEAIKIFK